MSDAELISLSRRRSEAPPLAARVALVNMPFGACDRPSIQCGLLKAVLQRAGCDVDVHHLNLHFAVEVGAAAYKALSHLRTELFFGDWLFAAAAFGPRDDEQDYRRACPAVDGLCSELGWTFDEACAFRNQDVPAWIDHWLEAIDWSRYGVVGFSCTFEQNAASFAMARAIKARHPAIATVFGGANFDGEMGPEYLRALPFVDHVVIGEGDEALPRLVARLAAGGGGAGIPGVVSRIDGQIVSGGPPSVVRDLDALPVPDYDDYFASLFALGTEQVLGDAAPLLLFESARGCWWGQKHHCTFCGLNAGSLAFRHKSPARVHAELRQLSSRYKIVSFEAVDNIMATEYLTELCTPLSEERLDYQIFYEVKANLTRDQLRGLARAGVTTLQPGIESLSTHLLKLMRKGVTALRNVRMLKWAHYHGIRVGWNILTGFPGETEADYEAQVELLPKLFHLPPPSGCGPVWLERFSPYFSDRSFPVRDVRPRQAYRWIYPPETIDLARTAYFFDYTMAETVSDELPGRLRALVEQWKQRWEAQPAPLLVYQRAPDWIQVIDRRALAPRVHALSALEAAVYECCGDTDLTREAIAARLAAAGGRDAGIAAADGAIDAALERLCGDDLMLEDGGHYLSLALPVNLNW